MRKLKLTIKDLTISFRTINGLVRAVRGVNFGLEEGETLAIVGESGSGKSVTAKAIIGILAGNAIIDQGNIMYEGEDLAKVSERQFHKIRGKKIGMIFQDPLSSLNPIMKIGKQITEGMMLNGNHYQNKIDDLAAREKAAYYNVLGKIEYLKKLIKNTKDDSKKKAYQAEIKELKPEKRGLKQKYNKARKSAKVIVDQEWKAEKDRVNGLISQLKAKLKISLEDKVKIKKEIEDLKENLQRFKRVTKKEAFERAVKVMEEVGIPDPEKRFYQYPFQFSGGMRQRIVIAIVLTANPDILICDEPTTALDVTIQAQILELINELKRERNLTVIFITHDLGVVANMADRIAVMYAGKIVEIGRSEDVFYSPQHPYTWVLLGSTPDITSKKKLTAIPGTPPDMLYPPEGDAFAARNKYAMKIDFVEEPPMFKVSETHYAATWLLHKDSPKIGIPNELKDRIERMKNLTKEVASDV